MTETELMAQVNELQQRNAALVEALDPIYNVLHCIHDQCEDEGDRIYLGSTNDRHTMLRQLRRMEKLLKETTRHDD